MSKDVVFGNDGYLREAAIHGALGDRNPRTARRAT
jgi:hypothetical protein